MLVTRNVVEGVHKQDQVIALLFHLLQNATKLLKWLFLLVRLYLQIYFSAALSHYMAGHCREEIVGGLASEKLAQVEPDKNMMAQIFTKALLNLREAHTP